MSSTSSLQVRYDSFVQDIYRDILKKEGFAKAHGRFVRIENGIIYAVWFTYFFDRNDKKKDTLRFQIHVEARLEHETQMRREKRLTTGMGVYTKCFQEPSGQKFRNEKMQRSEEALLIQGNTETTALRIMVKGLLSQALEDVMRFQTEEELAGYLNAEHEEYVKSLTVGNRRHALFEFVVYGILGVAVCLFMRDWFYMAFVSIIYYDIILRDMELSDAWFRRMLSVPVAELLVMVVLFVLIWRKAISSYVAEKVCISLLFGLVHLVDYLYCRHVRKKWKELLNNRRFWGGA